LNSPAEVVPNINLSVPAVTRDAPKPSAKPQKKSGGWLALIDSDSLRAEGDQHRIQVADPVRFIPYAVLHLGCLGVIWAGWSWTAVIVALALYWGRMFAITGFITAISRTARSVRRGPCSLCWRCGGTRLRSAGRSGGPASTGSIINTPTKSPMRTRRCSMGCTGATSAG
jgi:hypothetical protein